MNKKQITSRRGSKEKSYHLDKSFITDPLPFGDFRLFQLGRRYCTPETVIEELAHIDWFELTVATDGKGIVYTNGAAVPIVRGDIYFSFPCDHHAIVLDLADPLKYDFFSFSTSDESLAADLSAIMERNAAADARIVRDEQIASLVSTAIAELNAGKRHSERLLTALFSEIIIRLVRGFFFEAPPKAPHPSESPDALCYRLMHYIDTHIYSMENLEELSALTGYNYSYLSALFRRITSESLSEYYRNRRLETARLHIMENALTITQIAELLRYSSIYTFSRAFKQRFGTSPEQYRKIGDA